MFTKFKCLTWKSGLLATLVSLLVSTIALAASGDLDTTFSDDGLVTTNVVPSSPGRSDVGTAVAIQLNGRIVVAGYSYIPATANYDFAIARYMDTGALDKSFSGDGRLVSNFGAKDQARDIVIQPNGGIVVVGQTCDSSGSNCDVALARYKSSGLLDTSFSGDGKQTSDFDGNNNGSYGGVALQSDGKIVVAGYVWNGSDYDFALYRYLPDGVLDTSFGGDGMVSIGFNGAGWYDWAYDLVIQSNGKILVAGYTGKDDNGNFAVARLNTNGSLDTTFGSDGKVSTNFGGDDIASSVALQANGRVVVTGTKWTTNGDGASIILARYLTNGNLDTTFNSTGKVLFQITPHSDYLWGNDVIVQSDGKIVVLGATENGGSIDFLLVRLNGNGTFHKVFSGDGKATFDFGGDDYGGDIALQADGKYVLVGTTENGTQKDFALARALP